MKSNSEFDNLIQNFVDGQCSETESRVLFEAMREHPELQDDLQRALRLQSVLQKAAASYTPPEDLKQSVAAFVGLQTETPTAASVSTTVASIVAGISTFQKLLIVALCCTGIGLGLGWSVFHSDAKNTRQASETDAFANSQSPVEGTARGAASTASPTESATRSMQVPDAVQSDVKSDAPSHRGHAPGVASSLSTAGNSAGSNQYNLSSSRSELSRTNKLSISRRLPHSSSKAGIHSRSSLATHTTPANGATAFLTNDTQVEKSSHADADNSSSVAELNPDGGEDVQSIRIAQYSSQSAALKTSNSELLKTAGIDNPLFMSSDVSRSTLNLLPDYARVAFGGVFVRSSNAAGASGTLQNDPTLKDWNVGLFWKLGGHLDLGIIGGSEYLPLYLINGTDYQLESSRYWAGLSAQYHTAVLANDDYPTIEWIAGAQTGFNNAGTQIGLSTGLSFTLSPTLRLAVSPDYRLQYLQNGSTQFRASRIGCDIAFHYTL